MFAVLKSAKGRGQAPLMQHTRWILSKTSQVYSRVGLANEKTKSRWRTCMRSAKGREGAHAVAMKEGVRHPKPGTRTIGRDRCALSTKRLFMASVGFRSWSSAGSSRAAPEKASSIQRAGRAMSGRLAQPTLQYCTVCSAIAKRPQIFDLLIAPSLFSKDYGASSTLHLQAPHQHLQL
jgi:hypothetical protein